MTEEDILNNCIKELRVLCDIYKEGQISTTTFLFSNIPYYTELFGTSEKSFPVALSPEDVADNLAKFVGKFTSSYGAFFASELVSNVYLSKLVKLALNTSKLESIIKQDSKVKRFFRRFKYLSPIVLPAIGFKVLKYFLNITTKLYSSGGNYIPSQDYSISTLLSLFETGYYMRMSNYYSKKYFNMKEGFPIKDYVLSVVEGIKDKLNDGTIKRLFIKFLKTAYPYMNSLENTPPYLIKYVDDDGKFLGISFDEFK